MKEHLTIVSILQERASCQPNKIAYTFLQDGEIPSAHLTYQELDQKAIAIASALLSKISPGERALLMFPQGLEFLCAFFGCLYAGVIAIPTPAPEASRFKRLLPRIEAIIQDAEPTIVLTTSKLLAQQKEISFQCNHLPTWLATDTINYQSEKWLEVVPCSDDLAYLQYTSGSTASPKGVMIKHHNLMHNLAWIYQAYGGYNSESICLNWVPHFHDYGLVGGLLQPLYASAPCYVMSPLTFIKQPMRWLKAISDYRVTHSGGPNFAYDHCVQKVESQRLVDLNLSNWCVAHTGAEPIYYETLVQFAQTFVSCGFKRQAFCPSYGLAESTLMVTTKKQGEEPNFCNVSRVELARDRIIEIANDSVNSSLEGGIEEKLKITLTSCGYPSEDMEIAIMQPETLEKLATHQVGEIWVSGASVAQGYWNYPDESQDTFQAYIKNTGEGPFLRTGDLGFIKDGQLFITGRLKDLIIIRGQNYYPEDIEWTINRSHSALSNNSSAVFSEEVMGIEQLIVATEVEKSFHESQHEIFTAIHQAVAQFHNVSLYKILLLKRGSLSKTSSGKIQRNACRTRYLDGNLNSIATWTFDHTVNPQQDAPRDEIEFRLIQIWKEVLNIQSVGIRDNFFELGGDSLKAASVLVAVEALGQRFALSSILENPTIEQFACYLNQQVDWPQDRRSLVSLKPFGSKRPLYYVHPRSGSVIFAGRLASCLDPERPMYGLQSVGLDGEQEPYRRIEDMAAYYIHEIQTVQPNGPYLLGGRCMGGAIAFEMAQQLLAQGQNVLLVVNVEGPRTHMVDPMVEQKLIDEMRKMQDLNADQANRYLKVMNANDEARSHYVPKVYPGRIAYFAAEGTIYEPTDGFGWADLTIGGLDIYKIPGTHMNVDMEPQVQIFANILSDCLDRVEQQAYQSGVVPFASGLQERLHKIRNDLERSRSRLAQIKLDLEQS